VRDVTDEVLVRRVTQSGDERAISKRYDRYAGLIYGVGDGCLGDRALAEDLVQDAFTAVWRGAGGLIPSGRASRRGFIASRATGRRT
jgi:DNA-directed RNA polymerase specialized sigma24 family protein